LNHFKNINFSYGFSKKTGYAANVLYKFNCLFTLIQCCIKRGYRILPIAIYTCCSCIRTC